MTNSQRLATVRAHLQRWLGEQSASAADDSAIDGTTGIECEAILIVDGFYAGRTMTAVANNVTFRATWFMEPDELKIRDSTGAVVARFAGDEIVDVKTSEDNQPQTLPMPTEQDDRDEELPQAA